MMKIARVIGTVTLARSHPTLPGIPFRLVETVESFDQANQPRFADEQIVACDMLGASVGDLIALAEGPEAAQPFRPEIKPIDANSAAILDTLEL
jgi:microcompartment protein CcmK/EutM